MTETAQQWLRDNALTVLDVAVDAIITIAMRRGAVDFIRKPPTLVRI
jgi:FixJ family two-component response regulator